ncbi:MAG: flagellar hook-basal body complex protein [Lawsonibacter sp.]|nr:flagellar hook-basal body complex protein [Lawsonibacter sp.]
MTGSMYAGIAGLKAHMQNLSVIGHNIANVNTSGYKAGRGVFSTALYTQISGGSDGTTTVGGKNPSQLGYGSKLATVDIDMSTGTYAPGRPMDCMIDGDGFFLIGNKTVANVIDASDSETLKSLTLTRVGDIEFKSDSYLCNYAGECVYGFQVIGTTTVNGVTEPIFSDQLVPIRLPRQATDGTIVYPKFAEAADVTNDPSLKEGQLIDNVGPNAARPFSYAQFDSISIDPATGIITGTTKDTSQVITIGAIAIGNVTNPNGVTQLSDTYYKCGKGAGELSVSALGGLNEDMYVINGNKNAAGASGIGYTPPVFDADGKLQTAASFTLNNPVQGFQGRINQSMAVVAGTDLTTLPQGTQLYSGGTTALLTGGLEMSKTDLATEIANMITTQRGYQANTRVITVTDSMLEELVNMKR